MGSVYGSMGPSNRHERRSQNREKMTHSRVAVLKKEVSRFYSKPAYSSGAGTFFEQEGVENMKCKFRFCPKITKHLHQLIISIKVAFCTFSNHLT